MTENKGATMPVKLTGSVTVSTREVTPEGDSVARLVRRALSHADLVDLVMVLAKVSQAQAEYLVSRGHWEDAMHQLRQQSFRRFQASEDTTQ